MPRYSSETDRTRQERHIIPLQYVGYYSYSTRNIEPFTYLSTFMKINKIIERKWDIYFYHLPTSKFRSDSHVKIVKLGAGMTVFMLAKYLNISHAYLVIVV